MRHPTLSRNQGQEAIPSSPSSQNLKITVIKFLLTHFVHPAERQKHKPKEFAVLHIVLLPC